MLRVTREEKMLMLRYGLGPSLYEVIEDKSDYMIVKHRVTGQVRYLYRAN